MCFVHDFILRCACGWVSLDPDIDALYWTFCRLRLLSDTVPCMPVLVTEYIETTCAVCQLRSWVDMWQLLLAYGRPYEWPAQVRADLEAWLLSQPGEISGEHELVIRDRAIAWMSERQREREEAQRANAPDGEENPTGAGWKFSDFLHDEQDIVLDSIEDVDPEDKW